MRRVWSAMSSVNTGSTCWPVRSGRSDARSADRAMSSVSPTRLRPQSARRSASAGSAAIAAAQLGLEHDGRTLLVEDRADARAEFDRQALGEPREVAVEHAGRDVDAEQQLVPVGAGRRLAEAIGGRRERRHDVVGLDAESAELGDERVVLAQGDPGRGAQSLLRGQRGRGRDGLREALEELELDVGRLAEEGHRFGHQLGEVDLRELGRRDSGTQARRLGAGTPPIRPEHHGHSLSEALRHTPIGWRGTRALDPRPCA